MYKLVMVLISSLLVSTTSMADHDGSHEAMERPSVTTSQTVVVTAVVEAISHETRAVSLRGPEGDVHAFVVGEEAVNLDQVNIGDTVVAEYVQSMNIRVVEGNGSEPSAGAMSVVAGAEKGSQPGMTEVDAVVVTAELVEINLDTNTFKLKGPKGNTKEYLAMNPENLKKVTIGDMVIMTYTESVGLSLEKSTIK